MSVVLITGSEGTLGRKLRVELEGRGHEVWGCDLKHDEKPTHIRADIAEYRQLERVFDKVRPEICFALAAEFGRSNGGQYHEQLWRNNLTGNQNTIDCCVKYGTHMVFASSSEAYGDTAEDGKLLHEDLLLTMVPNFHNTYALSKYCNERQIMIAINNSGLKATTLRFFNSYSEEEFHPFRSVICIFIYHMLHDLPITVYKDYKRIFLHMSDWSRTVANVVDRYKTFPNGTIINIAGEEYVTIDSVVDRLKLLIPESKSVINYLSKEAANITNKRADTQRAVELLDHKCLIDLAAGLPLAVEWQRKRYNRETTKAVV